ncbi:protein of unknown function [Paracoccus isoporae]|uniref:3-keto-alpha-glucoside-1,2-lyase/3-keto-2-hydroxy-glucal hydratase domain-containing protein n=1 Tax=Paracoccus isoporae TaxID=591205 RepID=A0A1G7FBD0_9RHOB|nr:DUF1080 domain-containing protein [Paracoccus isoporae]SDE73181.1 protein of unknown function [Paracoccus isoporae]
MNHFLTTTALAVSLCAAGLAHAQDSEAENELTAEQNAAEAQGVPAPAAAPSPAEELDTEDNPDAAEDAGEDDTEGDAPLPEPARPDAASDMVDPAATEAEDAMADDAGNAATESGSAMEDGASSDASGDDDGAGEGTAGDDMASDAAASEDMARDDAAGEEMAGEEMAGEDMAGQDAAAAGGDAEDGDAAGDDAEGEEAEGEDAATAPAMDDAARSTVTEIWEPVPETVDAPADAPPSDAVVLFDGSNLDAWESVEGGAAPWQVADGVMTVERQSGAIRTKESFCDVQMHIEWRAPEDIEGFEGQDRGNSGVFFQELYEVQVLDSSDNPTYANGQAASVYKQHIPLVNASRGPGEWQEYDIIFDAPEFSDEGDLEKPAYITVFHNGVVVQNHVELQGGTVWIGYPQYQAHGCAPIQLQDHDASVSYRNIWVRPM